MAAPKGNTNALKGKIVEDILRKALIQDDYNRLRVGMQKVLDQASGGDRWSIEFIRDTMDGKPKQQIDHANAEGESFKVSVIETVILPKK